MTQLQNLTDRSVKIIVLFLVSVNRNISLFRIVNRNQNIPEVFLQYQKLIGENFNYRREIIPLYSDSELKQLTMPTILFVGEKDVIFHSAKTAKRLGNILPHANINIIPEAGHALINLADRISVLLSSNT